MNGLPPEAVKWHLLSQLDADDDGLWQTIWNGIGLLGNFVGPSESEREDVVARLVAELLEAGLVEMYWLDVLPSNDLADEEHPVTTEDALLLLADPARRASVTVEDEDSVERSFWLGVTPAGVWQLRSLPAQALGIEEKPKPG